MTLSLVVRPGGFDDTDGFTPRWWAPRLFNDGSTYLAVVRGDGTEVARIEMVDQTHPGHYVGVTESPKFIKIHMIEVHSRHRRRGIAVSTLYLLADRYPERQLLAFSEADEFWESVGWARHVHRDEDPDAPRHQVLFIQPG